MARRRGIIINHEINDDDTQSITSVITCLSPNESNESNEYNESNESIDPS